MKYCQKRAKKSTRFCDYTEDAVRRAASCNGGKWVDRIAQSLAQPLEKASKILQLVATVPVPAIATFRAKDHFKDDRSGPIVIGYIGDDFRRAFLSGDGRVETGVVKSKLRIHKVRKTSTDSSIIDELGGEEVAETTLGQMYKLMKAQGQGQKGILLVNDCANFFYIRDSDVLWAVRCVWDSVSRCWGVRASPVALPYAWYAGRQVVSRALHRETCNKFSPLR